MQKLESIQNTVESKILIFQSAERETIMRTIILSLISFFICISCYAAPGILRHPGGDFDVVVYMGQTTYGDGKANVYTTQRSIDILLNATYYNEKDWGLYLLIEPIGVARQNTINSLKEAGISWYNTPSGSRIFWAMQCPIQTKNNILTVHPQEDFFNDHGELMGAHNADGPENINLSENTWFAELDHVVLNYLNREYSRRKNMDNGQPVQ